MSVVNDGHISTSQSSSLGIVAQSNGGMGGDGGLNISIASNGGDGGSGGAAGAVSVTNSGSIETGIAARGSNMTVTDASAIVARSAGGDGGNSGSNITGLPIISGSSGGTGGNGGAGGTVTVSLTSGADSSTITTWGDNSAGVIAQSAGGNGGKGELTVSLAAGPGAVAGAAGTIGGKGGGAGDVIVNAAGSIITNGNSSVGIFANSAGGDGGEGGLTITAAASTIASAAIAVSREGGAGGNGDLVSVNNSATVTTTGIQSSAIAAISDGGKGGQGGSSGDLAVPMAAAVSASIGGNGGAGGNAGASSVVNLGAVSTSGAGSAGVIAQSNGGEGGAGGKALALTLGTGGSLSGSVGGKGGVGGQAGKVTVANSGVITTAGGGSSAIAAQSIGGDGGAGEGNGTGAFTSAGALTVAGGNDGGMGGHAGSVLINNTGNLTTAGSAAAGISAVSQGGEGGNGGNAVSIATASVAAASGVWSGKGGNGGAASDVAVINAGTIITAGVNSSAIDAQSLGGAGGDAGLAGAAGLAVFTSMPTGALSVGFGQGGAEGGSAGNVSIQSQSEDNRPLDNIASIATFGDASAGILAQSSGGTGGAGGLAGALSGSLGPTTFDAAIAIGGNGGTGGNSGHVVVSSFDNIVTKGNDASAIKALASGGSGGQGGAAGTLALEASTGSKSYGGFATISGSGGEGGVSGDVEAAFNGQIATYGDQSHGIDVATIGGKGGDASNVVGAGVSFTPDGLNIAAGVGGAGGAGGNAGNATIDFEGIIVTEGNASSGVVAKSSGGNGGAGAVSVSTALGQLGSTNIAATWGRKAGDAGLGGDVEIQSAGIIITEGDGSDAIYALSSGGTGGAAQHAIAATAGAQSSSANSNISIAVAGNGGSGASAGTVSVGNTADVYTTGSDARAIVALSAGGDGSNGGASVSGAANLAGINTGQSRVGLVTVAGTGGASGAGSGINMRNDGSIQTEGANSSGLVALSSGGSGGQGGEAGLAHLLFKAELPEVESGSGSEEEEFPSANTYQLLIGAAGGNGGVSGTITVANNGKVQTAGAGSSGIDAQSIGGNGGTGGSTNVLFTAADVPVDEISQFADKDSNDWIIGAAGTGGAGGTSGSVNVTNTGIIITEGDASAGIVVRSVGGAGGNSGNGGLAGGSLGIGGGAFTEIVRSIGDANNEQSNILDPLFNWAEDVSAGGHAGNVSIVNGGLNDKTIGAIFTEGSNSGALIAQTSGGNGGDGGNGVGKIAFGGDGGRAGNAGAVDLENHAYLITAGDNSAAIAARSLGGAGGNGGNASSGDDEGAYLTFGGRGGAGGSANQINILNQGIIAISGQGSQGILAQSIGGNGGNSGSGDSTYAGIGGGLLDTTIAQNFYWLGTSGEGGHSADVRINNGYSGDMNAGAIFTYGDQSDAIWAESLGGQGGAGGSASGYLALAGDGGKAGDAGVVDVNNHASLITKGIESTGIVARSMGGAGGTGGDTGSHNTRESIFGVGGRAGAGGSSAAVIVNNAGVIETFGDKSSGIIAQSQGGNAGNGGDSNTQLTAAGGNVLNALISGKAEWYGKSALGGASEAVFVRNGEANNADAGLILSHGDNSALIIAQSVGGDGGNGGNASGLMQFDIPLNDYKAAIGLSLAGDGGDAGSGSTVRVENFAVLASEGRNSTAIAAQSLGGQGGDGGNAGAMVDDAMISLTAAAGGLSGSGGNADLVAVLNRGSIYTLGDGSVGIKALSAGGDAGIAGDAAASLALAGGALSGIGGIGNGAGGNGGDVSVVNGSNDVPNQGLIYTAGHNATAIIATSRGGNGSAGGNTAGILTLGGAGGNGGSAGGVSVENYATLITQGDRASGILAQSHGGQGGFATMSDVDSLPVAADGVAGSAGAVTVANSGTVVTRGTASQAIAALSQGAAAGEASVSNAGTVITTGDQSSGVSAQSLGSSSAANVSLTNKADIVTEGTASNALVARSVADQFALDTSDFFLFAGSGFAGNVLVDHVGDLIATGADSSAIYAQSSGIVNGNIDVVVQADSIVVGGSAGGAGVSLIDGAQNSLVNAGTITAIGEKVGYVPGADGQLIAVGWVDGQAIQGTTGNTHISNTGLIVGSVDLGSGSGSLTNEENGWLVAGDSIGLGGHEGSLLANEGNLTLGGISTAQTTKVIGNFNQTESGNYLVDVDFAGESASGNQRASGGVATSGKADRLDVSGWANLAGRLPVSISNAGYAQSGSNDYVIVHAEGGINDDGMVLVAPSTAVATFTLAYSAYEANLTANIDYAASGLTENGIAVGNTINSIQLDQTSPAFRPLAEAIFAQPDIASLQRTYDLIDGEGTAGAQQAYFSETNAFIGTIAQQTSLWSNPYRQMDANAKPDRDCVVKDQTCASSRWRGWFSGFGSSTSVDGDPTVVGSGDLRSHSKGMAAGFDYQLSQQALLGFAIGVGDTDFKVTDRLTSGDMQTGRSAIYGAYKRDNFYIDGLLGLDWFNVSTERFAAIGATASNAGVHDWLQNDFSGYGFNMRLEGGYRTELGGVQLTPFAALQLSSFHMNGSTERADVTDGSLALYYKNRTINSVPLTLGAQFDTRVELSENAHFTPYMRASWVHEFANKRSVEAGFTAAPGYEFVVHGAQAPRDSAQLEAGFNVQIETGLSLYGKVTGNLSRSSNDISGSGGFRLRW